MVPRPRVFSTVILFVLADMACAAVVTNTNDTGAGSLRQAILDANAEAGSSTVSFDIPQSDINFIGGVYLIRPVTQLPTLSNATIVDGTSQPVDTNPNGPEIVLNGLLMPSNTTSGEGNGLRITGIGCAIKRLVIQGFRENGVLISGSSTTDNMVVGCYIGTSNSGTATSGNNASGVSIVNGAYENLVGGPTVAERNIISGNDANGISLSGSGIGNQIQGNYIGVDRTGAAALPNNNGIEINTSGKQTVIGGAGLGNVISGNKSDGVFVRESSDTSIMGNVIGLNAAGDLAVPNENHGILLNRLCPRTLIGDASSSLRNVISGNAFTGISIFTESDASVVEGNYIGTDSAGVAARANNSSNTDGFGGVFIATTKVQFLRNLVSGNQGDGIKLAAGGGPTSGSSLPDQEALIQGNIVGLNAAGTAAIPNSESGLVITASSNANQIGGRTVADRNVFSGNGHFGLEFNDEASPGADGLPERNVVEGNWIGIPLSGSANVSNGTNGAGEFSDSLIIGGIGMFSGKINTIGGTLPGAGNVISGNAFQGILLHGPDTVLNRIEGNWIGLDPTGTTAIGNRSAFPAAFFDDGAGINVRDGAQDNVIGGRTPGTRNYVSGNEASGITLRGSGTTRNQIFGNSIGTNVSSAALGNAFTAVTIFDTANNNQIGGAASGTSNTLAHNKFGAISIHGADAVGNTIRGNSIYSNTGTSATIDLVGSGGITANDLDDVDSGPNGLQNFPVISTVAVGATGTTVAGSLQSTSNTNFRIEFFAGPTGTGPTAGIREGKYFMGSFTNSVGAPNGTVSFSETLTSFVPVGWAVTATATDIIRGTSEFSAAVAPAILDNDGDGMSDAYENANGLNALSGTVDRGDDDAEGDGLTNIEEMRLGTDPQT
jgi:hypothetical protein